MLHLGLKSPQVHAFTQGSLLLWRNIRGASQWEGPGARRFAQINSPAFVRQARERAAPGAWPRGPPRQPHPPMRPCGHAGPPTRFTRRHLSHCHGAANYSHICLQLDKTGLEVKCWPQPLPLAHSVPRAGTLHIRPRCVGGKGRKGFWRRTGRPVGRRRAEPRSRAAGRASRADTLTSSERGVHWEPPAGLWLRPCLPRTMLSQRCSCPKFRSVLKGFMLICFLAKNVSTLGVVFK